MKNLFFVPLTIAAVLIFIARAAATVTPAPPSATAISTSSPENQFISMYGNNRQVVGRAAVVGATGGILVEMEVRGLLPGWHGVHIHSVGDCGDVQAFQNAGLVLARDGEDHGFLNAKGPQQGDLPNIWVGQDGVGRAQFFNTAINFGDLHTPRGSALVIYDAEDDFKTGSSGQPGNRIACGIIVQKQAS